eukprot:452674_1
MEHNRPPEITTIYGPFAKYVAKERLSHNHQKQISKQVDLKLDKIKLQEQFDELKYDFEEITLRMQQNQTLDCCSHDILKETNNKANEPGTLESKNDDEKCDKQITNALVLLICIAEFDKTKDLAAVTKDLVYYQQLFEHEQLYNYDVYPKQDGKYGKKIHWTKNEIFEFIEEYREKLFAKNKSYDCLIIIHRGYGGKGTILSSDHKEINVRILNDKVSCAWKYKSVNIPRIFVVDSCAQTEHNVKRHNNLLTLYGDTSRCVRDIFLNNIDPNNKKPKRFGELIESIDGKKQTIFSCGDARLKKLYIKPNKY